LLYSLEGRVKKVDNEGVVIETCGIGFYLMCSRSVIREASSFDELKVLTYLHITDAGPCLFAFMDEEERMLFILLLKVRGVGAKLAIAILRTLGFREIINSIASEHSDVLCQVQGVGKKTADRLCFELRHNIQKTGFSVLSDIVTSDSGEMVQVVYEALESLGFKRSESRPAVAKVIERSEKGPSSAEHLLRLALSELQRN